MEFRKITTDDTDMLKQYFASQQWRLCDFSTGAVMMWRDFLDTHFCELNGCIVFKAKDSDLNDCYTYPVGSGDINAALRQTEQHAALTSNEFNLTSVPKGALENLRSIYGSRMSEFSDRDCWDYLYDAEKMKTFSGKKLSGQRNHVNKFMRLYPECRFVPLNSSNIDAAREFCKMFVEQRQNSLNMAQQEGRASVEMFDYIEQLGLVGGVLELNGKIIALSLGEVVGDTLFVHVEKALHEYSGVYQVIVKRFAEQFAVGAVRFINREEDDGVEGLRNSKLSYHPVELLEKYNVKIKL